MPVPLVIPFPKYRNICIKDQTITAQRNNRFIEYVGQEK